MEKEPEVIAEVTAPETAPKEPTLADLMAAIDALSAKVEAQTVALASLNKEEVKEEPVAKTEPEPVAVIEPVMVAKKKFVQKAFIPPVEEKTEKTFAEMSVMERAFFAKKNLGK